MEHYNTQAVMGELYMQFYLLVFQNFKGRLKGLNKRTTSKQSIKVRGLCQTQPMLRVHNKFLALSF